MWPSLRKHLVRCLPDVAAHSEPASSAVLAVDQHSQSLLCLNFAGKVLAPYRRLHPLALPAAGAHIATILGCLAAGTTGQAGSVCRNNIEGTYKDVR
jgi:hypothetical protein